MSLGGSVHGVGKWASIAMGGSMMRWRGRGSTFPYPFVPWGVGGIIMAKFKVYMTATAAVSSSVEVEAKDIASAELKAMAMAKEGDVVWSYDGADDTTVEVEGVSQGWPNGCL